MSAPPVAGDFLGPAGEHIAAAISFRSELPYDAQHAAIRHLDRLAGTLGRYLADLCDDPRPRQGENVTPGRRSSRPGLPWAAPPTICTPPRPQPAPAPAALTRPPVTCQPQPTTWLPGETC
jgi:hypothetical protein